MQLERPELSLVGSGNYIQEAFNADLHDEVHSDQDSGRLDLNYFSFAYPVPFLIADRNACVSLNYQRKYDFTRKFRFRYNIISASSLGPGCIMGDTDYEQEGGLSALTPAFAIEVTPRLSVGAAFNFWRSSFLSDNRWKQTNDYDTFSLFGGMTTISHSHDRRDL